MIDTASAPPEPQTEAEYVAAFDRLMAEADSIHEQMQSRRVEIERLKLETRTIQDETRVTLEGVGTEQTAGRCRWEQRRDSDVATCDQENMILRAENARLRASRGLPPYDGKRIF